MREYLYLSDRKLQQFLPDPVPPWRRLGRFRAEVTTPLGSLSFEPGSLDGRSDTAAQLEKIVSDIGLRARWFEPTEADPLHAGEWIFFEDRINYWIFEPTSSPALVLFLNLSRTSARRTRLLLHGSAEHLTGAGVTHGRLRSAASSPSDNSWFRNMLPFLPRIVGSLGTPKQREPRQLRSLELDLDDVVRALDRSNRPGTAMWLAGYARVTAQVDLAPEDGPGERLAVASPLYAEIVSAPEPEDGTQ